MPVLRPTSAWSPETVETFLRQSRIPLRLACLSGHGAPQLCSRWYLYDQGALWCATQRDARLVSMLGKGSRRMAGGPEAAPPGTTATRFAAPPGTFPALRRSSRDPIAGCAG